VWRECRTLFLNISLSLDGGQIVLQLPHPHREVFRLQSSGLIGTTRNPISPPAQRDGTDSKILRDFFEFGSRAYRQLHQFILKRLVVTPLLPTPPRGDAVTSSSQQVHGSY
jgi:hypothetical protein